MARGLFQSAALALLVVCSDSLEADPVVSAAVDRVHVGRGSIAAGGAHTVMATPDGRVFAWGAGDHGQLGGGALGDRWVPTQVSDLSGIVTVAAGRAHSVAVAANGDVFAWGANADGRLGDGTRRMRLKPVRVRGLSSVRMVATGRAHTLALTVDGRVFAWGRNTRGQLGLGQKTSTLVPVQVPGLPAIASIAAGDAHSLAVTNDGRLFAWGRNVFAALGDGSTKNRATPVDIGLADVVSVAAGGDHSLALLKSGAVYSWGRGANGELGTGSTRNAATPKAIPGLQASAIAAGRHFSAAITASGGLLAWGANGSGQLGDGTLLRRLRPVEVRGVGAVDAIALGAIHAVAVTAGGDVRSWGEGASGRLGTGGIDDRPAPLEIIADVPDWGSEPGKEPADVTPPTIVASTSPPLTGGWMTTPVTVSFTCADDVELAMCPGPFTVVTDGFAQRITGTAVDRAGNTATVIVDVSLDLLPPAFVISAPSDGSSTPEAEVTVTGSIVDAGTGVADARCNGTPAAVVDGRFSCVIALRPGRNDIVLQAADTIGHSSSTAMVVTRIGTSTALTLTPATRRMAAGDVTQLSLRDEFGAAVDAAFWSTSDAAVVSLNGGDPPLLTAAGIGTAVIRAEKDGLIAEGVITVVPAMTAGDTRWTLPSTPLLVAEPPLFANRVAADVPLLFTVESESWGRALVRAVSSEGEVLWQQHVPGKPFLGDSFGGVIAGVVDDYGGFSGLIRLGGGTIGPWRYDSPGAIDRPAQAHDGTLYVLEYLPGGYNVDGDEIWDKYATVLDGTSGQVISRTKLTREVDQFISELDGHVIATTPPIHCRSYRYDYAPQTLGPFAGADGRGYFVVRRHEIVKRDDCIEPFRRRADRSITMGLDLVSVGPGAPPRVVPLYSTSCEAGLGTTFPCDAPVRAIQLMPDGIGGTVVTWERGTQMVGQAVFVQKSMTRIDDAGTIVEHDVAPNFSLEMMGQSGTAITYGDGWTAMDVQTGETKWSGLLPAMTVMAARPDGGVAAIDWATNELTMVDASGGVESRQPFGLDWRAAHDSGDWIGLRGSELAAVAGDFSDATRWSPLRGNAQGQLSTRQPGVGIFAKSHTVQAGLVYQHISIRITPTFQTLWKSLLPQYLVNPDEYGNQFFTLGAGTAEDDSSVTCTGTLTKGINRPRDVAAAPVKLERLPVGPLEELRLINDLKVYFDNYKDDLPYTCIPELHSGKYNSNSFISGLLRKAGAPLPMFPIRGVVAPGWPTPVPGFKFDPQ